MNKINEEDYPTRLKIRINVEDDLSVNLTTIIKSNDNIIYHRPD